MTVSRDGIQLKGAEITPRVENRKKKEGKEGREREDHLFLLLHHLTQNGSKKNEFQKNGCTV